MKKLILILLIITAGKTQAQTTAQKISALQANGKLMQASINNLNQSIINNLNQSIAKLLSLIQVQDNKIKLMSNTLRDYERPFFVTPLLNIGIDTLHAFTTGGGTINFDYSKSIIGNVCTSISTQTLQMLPSNNRIYYPIINSNLK